MADELEPVTQEIRADIRPYIEEFRKGEEEAKRFANENRYADDALKELIRATKAQTTVLREMRDSLVADSQATKDLKDQTKAASDAAFEFNIDMSRSAEVMAHARDEAVAEGRALADLRDHAIAVKEEEHSLRDAAAETAVALGHLRDEAIETAAAEHKLGKEAEQAAEKLDLMALSSVGTIAQLGPLLGIMGALVVAGAAVAPAFAAAGLGLGAFVMFAMPAIHQISSGMQTISKDQQALQAAATPAARKSALAQLQHDMAGLPAPVAAAVKSIQSFESAFTGLAKKSGIYGQVFKMVPQILGSLQSILPSLIPLAQQGAKAFGELVHWLTSGLQSQGFLNFLHLMTSMVVPAIGAILRLATTLFSVLGGALTQLAPLSIPFINFLNSLLRALGGPLNAALKVIISLILGLAQAIAPLLPGLSQIATLLINDIGSGFQAFIPIVKQVITLLGGSLLQILKDLMPVIANVLTPNSPFMFALNLLPGLLRAILPLFTWLASVLAHPIFAQIIVDILSFLLVAKQVIAILGLVSKAFGLLGLAFEATPVGWIVTAIGALVFAFYELWTRCAGFREFWIGLWADIRAIAAPIVSWIKNVLGDMARWWHDHGQTVMAIVKVLWSFISLEFKTELAIVVAVVKAGLAIVEGVFRAVWVVIRIATETVWNILVTIIRTAVRTIQDVINIALDIVHGHWAAAWGKLEDIANVQFHAIVSVIKSIASGFINILFQAGRDLIQGLINGIKSMWNSAMGLVGSLGSGLGGVFSHVLHILSPSRVFFSHGMNLMLGLVQGIQAGHRLVQAAMTTVAGTVAATRMQTPGVAYGVAGGFGGGAPQPAAAAQGGPINIYVDGVRLFQILQSQLYRYNVRNSGAITGVFRPGIA